MTGCWDWLLTVSHLSSQDNPAEDPEGGMRPTPARIRQFAGFKLPMIQRKYAKRQHDHGRPKLSELPSPVAFFCFASQAFLMLSALDLLLMLPVLDAPVGDGGPHLQELDRLRVDLVQSLPRVTARPSRIVGNLVDRDESFSYPQGRLRRSSIILGEAPVSISVRAISGRCGSFPSPGSGRKSCNVPPTGFLIAFSATTARPSA